MPTYAQVESGESLVFKFGQGDTVPGPETFEAACTINTDRKLEMSSDVYQSRVPRCDDPTAPAKTRRRVKSIDLRFTGAGTADMPSFLVLKALWEAAQPFNGKLVQDVLTNGWTITGSWIIENMSIGGTDKEDQTFDITIAIANSDWVWA